MTIQDAESGDIYADEDGRLWRVTGIWREPTIQLTAIEPRSPEEASMPRQSIGSVTNGMWLNFQRIYRRGQTEKAHRCDFGPTAGLPNLTVSRQDYET